MVIRKEVSRERRDSRAENPQDFLEIHSPVESFDDGQELRVLWNETIADRAKEILQKNGKPVP